MKKTCILIFIILTQYIMAQEQNKDLKNMYHQFDFWIGKWDVYKFGTDTLAGTSNIESIIDGIGLLENYSTTSGTYTGKSLNKYNPAKNRWEQYWIDNDGLTLFLSGGIIDGKMVLNDSENSTDHKTINRITWEQLKNGSVRQTWELSNDNGKTWSVLFDGEYKKIISSR